MERERQREAARYFEFAGVMMVVIDRDERVALVNRKACEVLGLAEGEVIGANWFDRFVPERLRDEVRSVFRKLMAGETEPVEYFENPVVTAAGEERVVEWHNRVLEDDAGQRIGTLSSGADVTERRRLASELVEKESLARLGEMAAVVAHEVRNPLAGMSGSLQNMAAELPPTSPHQAIVSEMLRRIADLSETLDDLLLYARPATPVLQETRVLPLLQESVSYLRRDPTLGATAVEVGGENLVIRCDPKLLVPVFFNLLLNAAQALEGEGSIRVEVTGDGERCRVAVSDSGPGIPAVLVEQVFEPFFTTRPRGTGLGLATARRVVRAHGGEVTLESRPGGGTTVLVDLPRRGGAG